MPLIACPECLKNISDIAKACPHCGIELTTELIKKGAAKQTRFVLLSIGLIALLFCICSVCLNLQPKEKTEAELIADKTTQSKLFCTDTVMAGIQAKKYVKLKLKSPSTAKFSWPRAVYLGECAWSVYGSVDAENSFGAMIRTDYNAKIRFNKSSESWELIEINM